MRLPLVLFVMFVGMSCARKIPPPPPVSEHLVNNSPCTFYHDFSVKERLSRKPFGQSDKIELVSFDSEYVDQIDSVIFKGCCRAEIPKKDSKIDRSQLLEIIPLSAAQVDSLTNIFFNYNFGRAENGFISNADLACYNPRHALLFFRKKTDVEPFAYFEICLECRYVRTFPKKYALGNFCEGKYCLLRDFFRQTGISFGLDN